MSEISALHRALLASYPPRFRARYGDELRAVIEDGTASPARVAGDLALGALRAWISPTFVGDPKERRRQRLESTAGTAVVAWSASVMAAAAFTRAVNDPPLPQMRGAAWTAFDTMQVALLLTAVGALTAGFVYWVMLVVPAARRGDRAVWLPAIAPAAIVAVWLLGTGLVALVAHHVAPPATRPHGGPSPVALVFLGGYAATTIALAMACAAAAITALSRARLSARRLAPAVPLAGLGAIGIGIQAIGSLICLVELRSVRLGVVSLTSAIVAVTGLLIATIMTLTSATRGALWLRDRGGRETS